MNNVYINVDEINRITNVLTVYQKEEKDLFSNIYQDLSEVCSFFDSSNNSTINNINEQINNNFKLIQINHENDINYLNSRVEAYIGVAEQTNIIFKNIGDD